jgi:hypothetical protein
MDPGAMALLAGAIAVSAALLALLNRRRASVASIPTRRSTHLRK